MVSIYLILYYTMQFALLLESHIQPIKRRLPNEVLGLTFEQAICLHYGIPYNGNYKYSLEEAIIIEKRMSKLKEAFPYKILHIAKNGNKYDFGIPEENIYLSAKTTKKTVKYAPKSLDNVLEKNSVISFI